LPQNAVLGEEPLGSEILEAGAIAHNYGAIDRRFTIALRRITKFRKAYQDFWIIATISDSAATTGPYASYRCVCFIVG
jgi:hypothetical protein